MQVAGITNEQEVLVLDQTRPFRIHEYLVLEDQSLNNPIVEVVETQSFNRFRDFDLSKGQIGPEVFTALTDSTQYDISRHDVHIAKVRLTERVPVPVRPGTTLRLPRFDEVAHLLVRCTPESGAVLGVIQATEPLQEELPAELQSQALLLEDGRVQKQAGVPFLFDVRAMQQYPHVGIFGGSGSGKSFGLRVFLEELMRLRIPALVLDPHFELTFSERPPNAPAGYCNLDYAERYRVFLVGRDVGVNFAQLTTRDLITLLHASSALSEGMTSAVEALHRANDSYLSFSSRVDSLVGALEAGEKGTDRRLRDPGATGSEREVGLDQHRVLNEARGIPLSSVKGIQWRLHRLYRAGLFTQDIRSIEVAMRAGQLAIIQGPVWLLNVLSAYVLGSLYRLRREFKDAQLRRETAPFFPPFLAVTDEAHNFAPKGYEAPAKAILREIAQEGRKYGVFLVLASQRPTLLDETITAQLNTKCVFRTIRASDIATIKEETDLTPEEARRLPYLRSGDAFVSSATLGRTIPIRVRMAKSTTPHTENPFDELRAHVEEESDQTWERITPILARYGVVNEAQLIDISKDMARQGFTMPVEQLRQALDRYAESGLLERQTFLGMVQYRVHDPEEK